MVKRLFIYTLFFLCSVVSFAADVQFVAKAPSVVANGQQFRIEFVLRNASANSIDAPDFGESMSVLMGPNVSRSRNIQMINGTTTSSESVSFSYVLMPTKEGTFTISPAKVSVDGKTIMSNSITIKVLPAESNPQRGGGAAVGSSQGDSYSGSSGQVGLSDKDVFCRLELSKTKAFEQEQIVATLKMYYATSIRGIEDLKMTDFKGFVTQEVSLPEEKKYGGENVNGRNYKTVILRQFVIFPQSAGTIEIEKGTLDIVAQVRVNNRRSRSIFDDMFASYADVKKTLQIPAVKVNVEALPTAGRPADFSGAVGQFQLNSDISSNHVKANEAINMKLKLSGSGNLKYAKFPELKFPNDFEIYDPKIDAKITASSAGVSGSKTAEYLIIPRFEGTYSIPSSSFSYFDPKARAYRTLSTPAYDLVIEKGDETVASSVVSNYADKENVKVLGTDIRFIDNKNLALEKKGDFFYGSMAYWLCLIVPLLLFVLLFFIYRKQLKDNSNLVLVKNKRANKLARQRLKNAAKFSKTGESANFYEEILKAMWGYVSDKLNIPVAELNKDNVKEELTQRNVGDDVVNDFISMLDSCEFARFAPSATSGDLDKVYGDAIAIIEKLEQQIVK